MGDVYIGEFCEGEKHGQGEYTWKNAAKYRGSYLNGSRTGLGVFTYDRINSKGELKSIHQEGEWLNGKFVKEILYLSDLIESSKMDGDDESNNANSTMPPVPPIASIEQQKEEEEDEISVEVASVHESPSSSANSSPVASSKSPKSSSFREGEGESDKENDSAMDSNNTNNTNSNENKPSVVSSKIPKLAMANVAFAMVTQVQDENSLNRSPLRSMSAGSTKSQRLTVSSRSSEGSGSEKSQSGSEKSEKCEPKPGSIWSKIGKDKSMEAVGDSLNKIGTHASSKSGLRNGKNYTKDFIQANVEKAAAASQKQKSRSSK